MERRKNKPHWVVWLIDVIIGICIVFAFAWMLSGCSTTDRDYTLYYRHAAGDEAGVKVTIKPGTGQKSLSIDTKFDGDAFDRFVRRYDFSKDL